MCSMHFYKENPSVKVIYRGVATVEKRIHRTAQITGCYSLPAARIVFLRSAGKEQNFFPARSPVPDMLMHPCLYDIMEQWDKLQQARELLHNYLHKIHNDRWLGWLMVLQRVSLQARGE